MLRMAFYGASVGMLLSTISYAGAEDKVFRSCNLRTAQWTQKSSTDTKMLFPETPINKVVSVDKGKAVFVWSGYQASRLFIVNNTEIEYEKSTLLFKGNTLRSGRYPAQFKFVTNGETFYAYQDLPPGRAGASRFFLDQKNTLCNENMSVDAGLWFSLSKPSGPTSITTEAEQAERVLRSGSLNFLGVNDGLAEFDLRESENGQIVFRKKYTFDPNAIIGNPVSIGLFSLVVKNISDAHADLSLTYQGGGAQ